MARPLRRWLRRWLGAGGDDGDAPDDPPFTGPLTIEQFELLRDEAPPGLEIISGSTVWFDGREHINGLIVGDRDSNEVIALGCPPDGDGWEEFEAAPAEAARGKLGQAIEDWEQNDY